MFLGIDLGTSSLKVIIIDHEEKIVFEENASLTISRPNPFWSEQNPEDWWNAACSVIEKIPDAIRGEILAIGLSGQMHGATLLDHQGKILRDAILWNDGRSFEECEEIEKRVPNFGSIVGNLIMPGFTAPKLLWVKKKEPDIFAKIDRVLLPKDYLRFRMTESFATEMSDAAGTCWLNVQERKWSKEMLEASGLSEKQMPELFEGSDVTGILTKEIAKEWKLSENVVVVGGGGDNAASAVSVGVVQPGKAFLSLGTSGVYFVSSNHFKPNLEGGVHTFCHCLPKLWHQMTVHLSCAASLDWLKGILNVPTYDEMMNKAKKSEQSSLFFLPYLSGERTPHNDPYARGTFLGLNMDTRSDDLIQAVLEGVAFAFADGQEGMVKDQVIEEVFVIGGGAKSSYWGEILASILQRELSYPAFGNVGAAFGAARLARLGKVGEDPEEILKTPRKAFTISPNQGQLSFFEKKRKIYQSLYPILKESFKKTMQLGEKP